MLKKFASSETGNFAIITAITLVPIMASVGVAIDYSAALSLKSRMQQTADTASLALAREARELSQPQAYAIATSLIEGNLPSAYDYEGLTVTKTGPEWEVSFEAVSPNLFMTAFGHDSTKIRIISTATHSTMSYEIALVLDTTGSMEGTKLRKLKEAATKMVTTMSKDVDDKDRMKFSLVPFSTFVNIGPQFAPTVYQNGNGKIKQYDDGAEWLDRYGETTADGAEIVKGVSRFTLFYHLDMEWEGCVETRQPTSSNAYDTTDLPATASGPRSLFVPAFHVDDPDSRYSGNSWLDDDPSWWNVPSGLRSKMTKYGIPVNNNGSIAHGNWVKPNIDNGRTRIYGNYDERMGPNFFCDSAPILPLTTDYKEVTDAIDGLYALGNTNVFEGLMWGWRVLSPTEPFAQGRPKDAFNNEKIIILLSDGNNTWNRMYNELESNYSSFGFLAYERLVDHNARDSEIVSAMDDKTLAGCGNAKADGITIYTIRLELDDSNSDELLRSCATSPEHYFDVPEAEELEKAFEAIRHRINKIRLSS